jgi:GH24 family phage-related lysozyme (muramidase)
MTPSFACLDQIRAWESPGGPMLTVQPDTGGKQQIGYGHNLLPGEGYPGGISASFAETLFERDIAKACRPVDSLLGNSKFTQGEYDALVSFTYECGGGALDELIAHGDDQVPAQLQRWVHASVNGVETVLPGMVARRKQEAAWWAE